MNTARTEYVKSFTGTLISSITPIGILNSILFTGKSHLATLGRHTCTATLRPLPQQDDRVRHEGVSGAAPPDTPPHVWKPSSELLRYNTAVTPLLPRPVSSTSVVTGVMVLSISAVVTAAPTSPTTHYGCLPSHKRVISSDNERFIRHPFAMAVLCLPSLRLSFPDNRAAYDSLVCRQPTGTLAPPGQLSRPSHSLLTYSLTTLPST